MQPYGHRPQTKRRFAAALLAMLLLPPAAQAALPDKAAAAVAAKDWAAATKLLEPLARKGDAEAQYQLALIYANPGKTEDAGRSMMWLRKAAGQGFAPAEWRLGFNYFHGTHTGRDAQQAWQWFFKAADHAGWAQTNIGLIYKNGADAGEALDTALKDKPEAASSGEAMKWFRKAADAGDAEAQFEIGLMYLDGEAGKQDDREAAEWLRKAAEQGHAEAQNMLGTLYSMGTGVKQDNAEAYFWTSLAAQRLAPRRLTATPDALAQRLGAKQKAEADARLKAWKAPAAAPRNAEACAYLNMKSCALGAAWQPPSKDDGDGDKEL